MVKRIYDKVLSWHFTEYRQMAFLAGPRQVGKTTILNKYLESRAYSNYLNWDNIEHREQILKGYQAYLNKLPIEAQLLEKPIIGFDEIHKYRNWRNYLKGFFDTYNTKLDIVVTGSARLHIQRRGGDSMMGRYFPYNIHPLSIAELIGIELPNMINPLKEQKKIGTDVLDALLVFGGFPESFTKQSVVFHRKWSSLRQEQLIRGDIIEIADIQEINQLELLTSFLKHDAGNIINYSNIAKHIRVSEPTVKRWLELLKSFYYCFTIKPWSQNITRSLIKNPKLFLWDWSVIEDRGAKIENMVAVHLLKAIDLWTDMGIDNYSLHFIRDKDQREVDFLVVKNNNPWLLVEVKASFKESLSKKLIYFNNMLKPDHALQVAYDLPFVDIDCFSGKEPVIVSLETFLSQLV